MNFSKISTPKFTILIRNTYRPTYFKSCIKSILEQTYSNYNIIICYDDDRSMEYLEPYLSNPKITIFKAKQADKSKSHFYNLYMNELLDKVKDGWILFLDDDNKLSHDTVLNILRHRLSNNDNIIFWKVKQGENIIFSKNINNIEKYNIDTGGFCFHSTYKTNSFWESKQCGDYYFITKLLETSIFKRKFINSVLAETQHNINGMHGLKEQTYNFAEFINSQYIEQIYISNSLSHLKARLLKKFNLKAYHNTNKPCIFFGVYVEDDIRAINRHRTTGYVMFGGSDVPNIKYVSNKNVLFLSISNDIGVRVETYKKKHSLFI